MIDNCSSDHCGEIIGREFPAVIFVQSNKNLGFAGANNLAATYASGKILLFLNPDTELHSPALTVLYYAFVAHEDAGVAGARLLNTDGSLQMSSLLAFPSLGNELCDSELLRRCFPRSRLWGGRALLAQSALPSKVEGISGACLMTSRKTFDRVGGFSNDYFMYYEDVDYCYKCIRAGFANYYIPAASLIHHGGKSSGGDYSKFSCVMMAESAWRYFRLQKGACYARSFRIGLGLKALALLFLLAVIIYPISFFPHRQTRAQASIRKWAVILNWAIGREAQWLAQYKSA